MKNYKTIFFIAITLFIQISYSQYNSIWVAGQKLIISMYKNQVNQLFKSDYNLIKFSDTVQGSAERVFDRYENKKGS